MAIAPTNISRVKTAASKVPSAPSQGTGEPLIGGVDFWMIAGLALFVDIAQILGLIGNGIATGIMTLTAIPILGVIALAAGAGLNFSIMLVGFLLGLALSGTILLYCFFKKIPMDMTRAGSQAFTLLAEQIPLINILPFNTINILLLRYLENKRRRGNSGLIGKAAGLIVNATPVGRIGKVASAIVK